MLGRRHLRAKVMQAIYAFESANDSASVVEKNMFAGIDKIFDLYIYSINFLIEIKNLAATKLEIRKQRHLATKEDLNPNRRFVDNPIFEYLNNNPKINKYTAVNKQLTWHETDEYIKQIYKMIINSGAYHQYMGKDKVSFDDHKEFVLHIFKYIIAPNEKIAEWYEDRELTWYDDYQVSNTMVYKTIENMREEDRENIKIYKVYKDEEDKEFTQKLFRTAIKEQKKIDEIIDAKAKNWDIARIARVDLVILKLALTELLSFPTIPLKVTLNEYIELAKEYSTHKSRIFVNGILDGFLKELIKERKFVKLK